MAIKGLGKNEPIKKTKKDDSRQGLDSLNKSPDIMDEYSNIFDSLFDGPGSMSFNIDGDINDMITNLMNQLMGGSEVSDFIGDQYDGDVFEEQFGLLNTTYSELGKTLKKYTVERLTEKDINKVKKDVQEDELPIIKLYDLRTNEVINRNETLELLSLKYEMYIGLNNKFISIISKPESEPGLLESPVLIYVLKIDGKLKYFLSDLGNVLDIIKDDTDPNDVLIIPADMEKIKNSLRMSSDNLTGQLFSHPDYKDVVNEFIKGISFEYFNWFAKEEKKSIDVTISELGTFRKHHEVKHDKVNNLIYVGDIDFNDTLDAKQFLAVYGLSGLNKSKVFITSSKNIGRIDPKNNYISVLDLSELEFINDINEYYIDSYGNFIIDLEVDYAIIRILNNIKNPNR